jgi:molybdopterin-guanine dinucleotide biosynthesis protein A
MRQCFIIPVKSWYLSDENQYICCTNKLASTLTQSGMRKIIRFTVKHDFDYYHNVKIFDEIFKNINSKKDPEISPELIP